MWIPGPFFATSKRTRRSWAAWVGVVVFTGMCLAASSCVVTDRIEFQEKVNHPPEVKKIEPVGENVVYICNQDSISPYPYVQEFKFEIWDADATDAEELYAKIMLMEDPPSSNATWSSIKLCPKPSTQSALVPEEVDQTGVRLHGNCDIKINKTLQGRVMLVKVVVSDRGFIPDGLEVAEEARVAELIWTVEVGADICN